MEDSKGGMRSASRAAFEGEVKGRQLDAPRACSPGEGEAGRNDVTGGTYHAMPPKAVSEKRESKAIRCARMGSA